MISNEIKENMKNAILYLRKRPFGQDKIDNVLKKLMGFFFAITNK